MKTALSFLLLCLAVNSSPQAISQEKAESSPAELFTRVYQVPGNFLSSLRENSSPSSSGASDPFAPAFDENPKPRPRDTTSRSMLEVIGLVFPEGASVIYNPGKSSLILRNTMDQHDLFEAYLETLAESSEKLLYVIVEYVEVEHSDFSKWLLSHKLGSDGTELRKEAQTWVEAGRGTIIETAMITARSGQRAKVESITEYIYPTEFDPPEIPNDVTLSGEAESPVTSITPTAYETRNLGTTLEVDPVLGSDGIVVDVNLAPEIVKLEGFSEWPGPDSDPMFLARMPTFYTMKITSQITVHDGRYGFLGTTRPLAAAVEGRENPIVLQFVRVDVGKLGSWSVEEAE